MGRNTYNGKSAANELTPWIDRKRSAVLRAIVSWVVSSLRATGMLPVPALNQRRLRIIL